MKYLKTYDNLSEEFPIEPRKPEDEPQSVPGFELGTIDPDDDEIYDFGENFGEIKISEAESYKTFLKVVKERNFKEDKDFITINMSRIGEDYCMSIYNFNKHLKKFLNEELKGKYVSNGFRHIIQDKEYEGIIDNVVLVYVDGFKCSVLFSLKLEGVEYDDDFCCDKFITIDKFKSSDVWKDSNKFNI